MPIGGKPSNKLWQRLLVVSGLAATGFAAPLLDLYGKNPEVFVSNRTGRLQIALFGILIAIVLPAIALLVMIVATTVSEKVSNWTYLSLIGVLAFGTGLVISRQVLPDNNWGAVVLAVSAATVVLYFHHVIPSILRFVSVGLPLALLLFLGTSETSRLIWADAASTAPASSSVAEPTSLVLVQLDEFPLASIVSLDGTVNGDLFPNFARLSEKGTWYRNALSNSIATTQSVPAILTGRLGENGQSPTAVDHPDSLFGLLNESHEMHVIEWVTDMCSKDICEDYAGRAPAQFASLVQDVGVVYGHLSLPPVGRERLPSIDNSWKGFLGQGDQLPTATVDVPGYPVPKPGIRSDWIEWIQRIENGISRNSVPTLSFVHLRSPHVPWQVNPSGTHYSRPEEYTEVDGIEGSGFWVQDPEMPLLGFQRHLYQLGFLDTMLGSLFDRLEETDMWDKTMIVVVADHGTSFVAGEHRRWPYDDNRDDLYRVPMFVKYPGQDHGEVVDEPAFGIDILPTVVDVMGIDTNWTFDGTSLRKIEGTDRPHTPVAWCCNTDGASTDVENLFVQVRRNHDWIPDQTSWEGVASVGPFASLIGTDISELDPTVHVNLQWQFDVPTGLVQVDRDEGLVQTLVLGRLDVPPELDGDHFLVSVNGQIAGVGFLLKDSPTGGSMRGILVEDMLPDGDNDVAILVRGHDGSGWFTGRQGQLQIVYKNQDGTPLRIGAEGNRRLQIDEVTLAKGAWSITGWAADVKEKKPPDQIYVFAGAQLVAHGSPSIDNPNVVRWFGSDDLLRSGFMFDIAATDIADGVNRLTIIAVFGDSGVADVANLSAD